MTVLNVESICAGSPQAKVRVEIANETLQDRLVKKIKGKPVLTTLSIQHDTSNLPVIGLFHLALIYRVAVKLYI